MFILLSGAVVFCGDASYAKQSEKLGSQTGLLHKYLDVAGS